MLPIEPISNPKCCWISPYRAECQEFSSALHSVLHILYTYTCLICSSYANIYITVTLMSSSPAIQAPVTNTYAIYPKDGSNTDQTDAIYQQLQSIVHGGDIYTSSSKRFGINFWTTDLTPEDADTIKANQDVSAGA